MSRSGGRDIEAAVTSALPEGSEAYFFTPLLLWHINGKCYGVFGSANQALAWQRGASARDHEYFYLTDEDGQRITVKDQPTRPGHAYAVLDALDRAERASVDAEGELTPRGPSGGSR